MEEVAKKKYDEGYYENIDFIYQHISEKFSRLDQSFNYVTNKAGFVLAAIVPLIAFYISLADKISYVILVWAIGLASLAAIFLLLIFIIEPFFDPPKISSIFSQESFDKDIFDLKNEVAATVIKFYRINKMILMIRTITLSTAICVAVISILIVSWSFIGNNNIHGHTRQEKEPQTFTCSYSH